MLYRCSQLLQSTTTLVYHSYQLMNSIVFLLRAMFLNIVLQQKSIRFAKHIIKPLQKVKERLTLIE